MTERLFGSFDVRLDPWEAEHSGELSIEAGSPEPAEEVDLSIEQQSDAWTPVLPATGHLLVVFAHRDDADLDLPLQQLRRD